MKISIEYTINVEDIYSNIHECNPKNHNNNDDNNNNSVLIIFDDMIVNMIINAEYYYSKHKNGIEGHERKKIFLIQCEMFYEIYCQGVRKRRSLEVTLTMMI